MNHHDITVGSLWLDLKAEVLFIPAGPEHSICWYIDNSIKRHSKIFIARTDKVFWEIQRTERFRKIV